MDLLSVIRRWRLRDEIPLREIERRTGLSRNTIRKYLRADTVVPEFKVPDRSSKLDPFAEKLTGWLQIEAGKSRKQKRTAKQMHADLVALGYDGSYNRVAAYVRDWKAGRLLAQQASGRGTYVPLVFQPGEAFQFDWSEDWAILGGEGIEEAAFLAFLKGIGCDYAQGYFVSRPLSAKDLAKRVGATVAQAA